MQETEKLDLEFKDLKAMLDGIPLVVSTEWHTEYLPDIDILLIPVLLVFSYLCLLEI